MMEETLKYMELISKNNDENLTKLISLFYQSFSQLITKNKHEERTLNDVILPKTYELIEKELIQKNILFLSIIANQNQDLLEKCLKYNKSLFVLNITEPWSLYDYCIYKKQHWFKEVINEPINYGSKFNNSVNNKMLLLKFIELSNSIKVSTNELKFYLENIKTEYLDEFWIFYINELKHSIAVSEYCINVTPQNDLSTIFNYAITHPILETFSKFINFDHIDWEEIQIQINNDPSEYMQSEIFNAFTILGCLVKLLILENSNSVNFIIENIKIKLLAINNQTVQLDILENIFGLIFIKTSHINKKSDEFVCKEKQLRLILYLLKTILDDLKLKNVNKLEPDAYTRFNNLNKYVADAAWRLELIVNVKSNTKCEGNLLKYMLAPAESLLQMCIKQGDFDRAYQVIEIFELEESPLASEIAYTDKLNELKNSINKLFKRQTFQKENPNISLNQVSLGKTVETFFKKNQTIVNSFKDELLDTNLANYPYLEHFKSKNEMFMDMFDLAITQSKTHEDCEILLQLAYENNTLSNKTSDYSKFCRKLLALFNEVNNKDRLTVPEILSKSQYNLDLKRLKKDEEFYNDLMELYNEFMTSLSNDDPGILNQNHPSHKILIKVNIICNEYVEYSLKTNENIKYLSRLFNYLKAFSRIFYIEQNTSNIISCGKNTSYFNLLQYNRSELMGKLLFEKHLDPSEFEKYFGKLKLDYLYHVIGNCFPTINLHTQENVAKEELYPENNLYVPSKSIITYIQKRNWLLAFVLNEMYSIDGVTIEINEQTLRVKTFINSLRLTSVQNLKVVFNNNDIITVLQNDISSQKLTDYINKQILSQDNPSLHSHNSNESLEEGEEILEDALKSTNWKKLLDIVESIPENQLRKKRELLALKDVILANLVQDAFEIDFYKYVEFISSAELRINTILNNFTKWPGEFCIYVINSELTRFCKEPILKLTELVDWLHQIELCQELKLILDIPTWSKCFDICCKQSEEVLNKLLRSEKITLLLKFIELHKLPKELLTQINEQYILKIFEVNVEYDKIKQLLDNLPYDHSIQICYNLLKMLKKLNELKFINEYLLNNVNDVSLKNVEISLKMLSVFAPNEQEQLLCLIEEPLHIAEILIMNTKLDKLSIVLGMLKNEADIADFDDGKITVEKIDSLLRNYAEKSLDFRVITQPNPRLLRTPECKLMQSFDSLNFGSDARSFVMPDEVPLKNEWVANDEVLECMCCQQITFSMFNRRHHCRRCGRVICYTCSLKRMQVPSYGEILVRVCSNCYTQTMGESLTSETVDTLSTKSIIYDYWLLTDDPDHNNIVREEFSYEHAPSVSLCLSIMKYHSKSVEYPKFFLERCNIMLKMLLPSQEPIQEIDYLLVIKMLKSLAATAKMSSVECNLHYGTTLADRILSQAELLGLLAERGCLNLLSVTKSNTQGSYIDAAVLRRLRDKLLEREQWNLALEVSTKAGLDNTGVFAAWGKSYLKAGSLLIAREKFQRILDKTSHYENSSDFTPASELDESVDSRTRYISKMSNFSNLSENKPLKNPPLLNEIIHILESKTRAVDIEVLRKIEKENLSCSMISLNQSFVMSSQPDVAISILNKLHNLKAISGGNYYQSNKKNNLVLSGPKMDPIFYSECIYYLTHYGTHLSLLEFYVKHKEMERALMYITDNNLSSDIFIEIYMKCLKNGTANVFQEHMSKIDSTLEVWKEYLMQLCRHLEKQNMLHALYQLQQYMGDYIRAAMSCIRFYQENSTSFTDLANKVNYLHKAEEHLKHMSEQEQWVEVASVRSINSESKESFEEKSITNPSLVMKMNSKEIDKHINTIWRQIDTVKFLSECESLEVKPMELLPDILPTEDAATGEKMNTKIPTLFGLFNEKLALAVLIIICGKNVEDGFEYALQIMNEFKLKAVKVYCEAGKQLAKAERYNGISQLVGCIKSSGTNDLAVTDLCDEMLTSAVATFTKANVSGTKVEDLIKFINDRATKISAYIEAKQLKTAYFLAVKYKRMADIRRILREAELLNQPSIKLLCLKVLQAHSHSSSHSKE